MRLLLPNSRIQGLDSGIAAAPRGAIIPSLRPGSRLPPRPIPPKAAGVLTTSWRRQAACANCRLAPPAAVDRGAAVASAGPRFPIRELEPSLQQFGEFLLKAH